MQEVTRMRMTTHPVEFDMYYSLWNKVLESPHWWCGIFKIR